MSTPADTQSDSPAYKKPYPPRKSRKPQAVKTAVIARMTQGQNKTRISNDLGITRNCVTAIAEESGIEQHLTDGRMLCAELIPASVRVVKHRLAQNSENAAFKLLEGIGVLGRDVKQGKQPEPGLTLAIQNLMGNVTVQSAETNQDTSQPAIDVKPADQQPSTDK